MKRVFAIILAAVSVFAGAFALSACACGSLKTFSKNSSMKNVYNPSDDYYIKITTTAL